MASPLFVLFPRFLRRLLEFFWHFPRRLFFVRFVVTLVRPQRRTWSLPAHMPPPRDRTSPHPHSSLCRWRYACLWVSIVTACFVRCILFFCPSIDDVLETPTCHTSAVRWRTSWNLSMCRWRYACPDCFFRYRCAVRCTAFDLVLLSVLYRGCLTRPTLVWCLDRACYAYVCIRWPRQGYRSDTPHFRNSMIYTWVFCRTLERHLSCERFVNSTRVCVASCCTPVFE